MASMGGMKALAHLEEKRPGNNSSVGEEDDREGTTVNVQSLSVGQLSELKKALDADVERLTNSFQTLRGAQTKFRDCQKAIAAITPLPNTTTMAANTSMATSGGSGNGGSAMNSAATERKKKKRTTTTTSDAVADGGDNIDIDMKKEEDEDEDEEMSPPTAAIVDGSSSSSSSGGGGGGGDPPVILAPLTSSLYVRARLASAPTKTNDTPSSPSLSPPPPSPLLLIDVGTGFFVEKTSVEATTYYSAKIDLLDSNLKKIDSLLQGKAKQLAAVEDFLKQAILSGNATGGSGSGSGAANGGGGGGITSSAAAAVTTSAS